MFANIKYVIIQIPMHFNFSGPFTGIITVDELPDVLDSIGLKPSPEEVEVRFTWNEASLFLGFQNLKT